jgi:hypothetical protein
LAFRSSRPTYGIILLVVSSLFMAATFLPLLYSFVFPNENLQRLVSALEEREPPSMEAETVVHDAIAAVGPLTRAIKVAYSTEVTLKIPYAGASTPEKIKASQDIYIAWFQKHPKAVVVALTCYENAEGQRAYQINEVDRLTLVRGYTIPPCLFGISLFLARKRKAGAARS